MTHRQLIRLLLIALLSFACASLAHAETFAVLGGAGFQELLPELRALFFFGLLWLVIGYAVFNWMERQARKSGTIGHY